MFQNRYLLPSLSIIGEICTLPMFWKKSKIVWFEPKKLHVAVTSVKSDDNPVHVDVNNVINKEVEMDETG